MAPRWTWANSLASVPAVLPQALAADAAGNTYVSGTFTAPLTLGAGAVLTSQGGTDSFVAKYGPDGALRWTCQLAGPGTERIARLVADQAGGVYLLGTSNLVGQPNTVRLGASALTATGSGNTATLLARLDAQGQPQWLRQPNPGSGAVGADLGVDAAGNLYLTGVLTGTATFGALTLAVPSISFDRYLVKLDPQGAAVWARQGGRVPNSNGLAFYNQKLVVSADGDAYLVFYANAGPNGAFGSVTLPPGAGDFDEAVVKYDGQGAAQWAQQGGGPGFDRVLDAALDGTGRLGLVCQFPGTATFGAQVLAGPGTQSGALVVLDAATGAVQWGRAFTSPGAAQLSGVAADPQGTWYVAGYFDGTGTLGDRSFASTGGNDAVVASVSAQGAVGWVQQSTGPNNESAFLLRFTSPGRLAVGGTFTGTAQLGNLALTSQGGAAAADGFVAQLASTPLASRAAHAAGPLALYPNPVATTGALGLPVLPAGTRLAVRDALGRTVRTGPAAASFPLAGVAPGLYQVQATAPNGQLWAAKFIVE
ncbi:hypothetical protein AXW84_18395 [Hymenobacter sp. PAMC 26628]|nr:hypothetical protein AXW84_18395 [Hymenobacter sp. PAMC 26628]